MWPSYSWVGRALHPVLGYLSGWALVVSATLFMVAGSLPAGAMTVGLFAADQTGNVPLVTAVGAVWFLVMVTCVLVGVHVTGRAQWIMSSVEVVILAVFAVWALVRAAAGHGGGERFSWSWFSPHQFHGLSGFAAGALIAAFYYWGWDVSASLNEETRDARRASGVGGIIGVAVVFVLFEAFTIAVNLMLTPDQVSANSGNVLGVLGQEIWPGLGGKLLVLAVMLSTIATLETTLIQVTRSLFAMGRDHTLPRVFGAIHRSWRTPWIATLVVAGVSLVLFLGSNFLGSVSAVLQAAVSSIGLQIAVYYALAGLAVVVAYRRVLLRSVANFVFIGLWPALGAVFLAWIFVESIPSLGPLPDVIGLGSLAVGVIPMAVYWRRGSGYFSRRGLVLAEPASDAAAGSAPAAAI